MRLFFNHIENAFEVLRTHRARTLLTVVGFTIAIACIAAVMSLVGGASRFFSAQVAQAEDTVAIVRTKHPGGAGGLLSGAQSTDMTTLTEADATALSRISGAKVAPMSVMHTGLQTKDSAIDGQSVALVGSTPALAETSGLEMLEGQFLTDTPDSSAVVIGSQLAIDLFGTDRGAIGHVVTIRDEPFTVVGVLAQQKNPVNYHGVDFDRSAIVGLDALKRFTQNVAQVQQIIIAANDKQALTRVVDEAQQIMTDNHHGDDDFVILTGDDVTKPNDQLFALIINVMGVIAAISLLAGGIGVMNIMLASAAERRREVGIRRALGATRGQIINQFLVESALIGAIGGLLGYALGMALAWASSMYLPFTPEFDWRMLLASVSLALLCGVVFGIYPAMVAASKDPIESLRQ